MLTRLALILALGVHQFALPALLAGGGPSACEATACCRVVERTTCCGERVVEIQCGETGGACLCGLEPGRSGTPLPAAPSNLSNDLALALLPNAMTVAIEWRRASGVMRPVAPGRLVRSHNANQARLGVWRT